MAKRNPRRPGAGRRPASAAAAPARRIPAAAGLAAVALAAVTAAVYARVAGFGFMTNYDDSLYVTENPHVTTGLLPANVAWAFTQPCAGNWHPLTMLSHMLDCQLFGVAAGPAHLENVAFHALNVLLLFAVLAIATGRAWPSLCVAGLFALHPMHVESVAWIAERKDVLSTCLWLLTMLAYVRYARKPGVTAYALVVVAFAAGLMAKPMLVTLPFVLILLDVWPLRRVRLPGAARGEAPPRGLALGRSLLEKVPLLLLVLVSILLTLRAQRQSGALSGTLLLPLSMRVANALVATVAYIVKLFAPVGLAAIYPYPVSLPLAPAALSAFLLVAVTVALAAARRSAPYALVGWLWFLGTLVPVIGVVQVGSQSMADRYTYIPHIGLYIALVWACADAARRWRVSAKALAVAAAAVAVVLGVLAWVQIGYWRDGTRLFGHAIRVTQGNFIAYNNYGVEALHAGRLDEAQRSFETATRINPRYVTGLYNLGVVYRQRTMYEPAANRFRQALALSPGDPRTELNLAIVLAARSQYPDAMPHYEEAYRLAPREPEVVFSYSNALSNYGVQMAQGGRRDDAIRLFHRALEVNPDNADAKRNLAYTESTAPAGR